MSIDVIEAALFMHDLKGEKIMNGHIIRIKNMVCPRCLSTVKRIAEQLNLQPIEIELGYIRTAVAATATLLSEFEEHLQAEGFELLTERRGQVTEDIKIAIIGHFYGRNQKPTALNFSDWLSSVVNLSYSHLSKIFSEEEGMTIEHYVIAQRIERAKELLSYGIKSMSEISDELEYRSPQHFSGQFKLLTGMSPSEFKKTKIKNRRNIDD